MNDKEQAKQTVEKECADYLYLTHTVKHVIFDAS